MRRPSLSEITLLIAFMIKPISFLTCVGGKEDVSIKLMLSPRLVSPYRFLLHYLFVMNSFQVSRKFFRVPSDSSTWCLLGINSTVLRNLCI